jgi:hypothetical protein
MIRVLALVIGCLAFATQALAQPGDLAVCVPPLGSVPAGQTTQCTVTFDSRLLADGPHVITVRAYNVAGEMVEASVTVMVDNSALPARPSNLNVGP